MMMRLFVSVYNSAVDNNMIMIIVLITVRRRPGKRIGSLKSQLVYYSDYSIYCFVVCRFGSKNFP